jgi:NADH-quinone oxidoreductase subunit M
LAAAYILWMVQRVFYGEITNPKNASLRDLSLREAVVIGPLVALALVMGVASPMFTKKIEPSVEALILQVKSRTPRPAPTPPPDAAQAQPPASTVREARR